MYITNEYQMEIVSLKLVIIPPLSDRVIEIIVT